MTCFTDEKTYPYTNVPKKNYHFLARCICGTHPAHPLFLPPDRSGLRGPAVNTFASIPKGPGFEPRRRPFFLFLLLSPLLSPLSFFHRFVHCKSSSQGVDQGSAQTWADPCSTSGCCSRSGQCVDPLSHERVALKLLIYNY